MCFKLIKLLHSFKFQYITIGDLIITKLFEWIRRHKTIPYLRFSMALFN